MAKRDARQDIDFNLLRILVAQEVNQLPMQGMLTEVANSVVAFNGRQQSKLFGIDPRRANGIGAKIAAFRDRNVLLIRNMADTELQRIQAMLEDPANVDLGTEAMATLLEKQFKFSEARAELIAIDQCLKLNGQVTQSFQEGSGIQHYIWTTSLDERVRPTHASKENKVFSWAAPPTDTGAPGQDYRCRCTAFPLLDELDEYDLP